jgi:hypothetical protein
MRVEGDGSDAATSRSALIAVPRIVGGIGGDVGRKEAQRGHGLHIEWEVYGI